MIENLQSRTVTWLRFVLAAMVVYIHVPIISKMGLPLSFESGIAFGIRGVLCDCICRLAVPCFFVISGYYFFTKLDKWDTYIWLQKLRKRIWTLLVPFILWNLIALAQYWLRSIIIGESFSFSKLYSERGIYIDFPLWFLKDLMVMSVAAPIVYFITQKTKIWGIIVISALCMLNIWCSNDIVSQNAFLFFTIGAFLQLNERDIIEESSKYALYAVIIYSIIVLTLNIADSTICFQHSLQVLMTVSGVDLIFAFSGNLMKKDKIKGDSFLSCSSFFIYAIHSLILGTVAMVINKLLPSNAQTFLLLKDLFTAILTIVISVGLFYISGRILPRLTAVLNGGRSF